MAPQSSDDLTRSAIGLAAHDASGHLSPFQFARRSTGDNDVVIKILFCGICHSDLHIIKNQWGNAIYPVVPGHEITGIVTEVGKNVCALKIGDKVGVGSIVNTCQSCDSCNAGFENHCPKVIWAYNSLDVDGTMTFGGYSDTVVVNEHYVIKFPDSIPLDKGAPLLCAGITVYSPMKNFGLNEPGKHIGVLGLGGLGHVAVKFGKAFGMKVTVISLSPAKQQEAIERLGADAFIVSSDPKQMRDAVGTMDGILNTVSGDVSLPAILGLLKPKGKMILLGFPDKPFEIPAFCLIGGGKTLAGSFVGGLKDTQEMINFASKHELTADIELIKADYVNTAIERLEKRDVRYRFVIDIANSLQSAA